MKLQFVLTLFFGGLILGIVIITQLKTDVQVSGSFPVDEIEARDKLVKDFKDEQSYLQSKIVNLREMIDEARESNFAQSENYNISSLNNLKSLIGLSQVSGRGLEITLDDSPFLAEGEINDSEMVQAADIRDIVNALFAANAEAISINKQRIISSSPISSIGANILANKSHISPPIYIQAVGDTEELLRGLNNNLLLGGLYDRVSRYKLKFEVKVSSQLTIPIYNADLNHEHITLIEQ